MSYKEYLTFAQNLQPNAKEVAEPSSIATFLQAIHYLTYGFPNKEINQISTYIKDNIDCGMIGISSTDLTDNEDDLEEQDDCYLDVKRNPRLRNGKVSLVFSPKYPKVFREDIIGEICNLIADAVYIRDLFSQKIVRRSNATELMAERNSEVRQDAYVAEFLLTLLRLVQESGELLAIPEDIVDVLNVFPNGLADLPESTCYWEKPDFDKKLHQ